jgi:NAD+ kinase
MKFAIVGNVDKSGIADVAVRLAGLLSEEGMSYTVDRRILKPVGPGLNVLASHEGDLEECLEGADMVLACGGDGTILWAARMVGERRIPILGVNLGKLGFLAEVSPEDMEEAIASILAGKYQVEDRLVLKATSAQLPGKVFHAVNDVVLDKARSSRLVNIEVFIDGAYAVTYRGDGLIVSTPTGSTAYALSNGGPIVIPTSRVIEITPISPHTLSGRPLVIPETSSVRIVVHAQGEEVMFSSDGQREALLTPPAELEIGRAAYALRLVKRTDRSYFDVLRKKLMWGQDPRG